MLKSILVLIFTLSLTQVFGSEASNPVDVINGSCVNWNPGYEASCQTCPKKVCPGGKKKCPKSEMKCVGSKDCNEWARGVCSQWKTFCRKYVVNEPKKGALLGPTYDSYLNECKRYVHGQKIFTTSLTDNDVTPDSNPGVTLDPGNNPGKNQGGQSQTGSEGLHQNPPGYGGFGDFCERSKEWCGFKSPDEEISDHVARKELKKFIYSKGVERIIDGMKKFEKDISMGGTPESRPSERLLDMACCGDINKTDAEGCLADTSYGSSTLAQDSGLNQDWAPEFCKGRVNACENARKNPAAIGSMDVGKLTEKLSRYTNELKKHAQNMIDVYSKLPVDHRMASTKECSEPLTPSQVKIGNPACQTSYLTLAQTAAKIRSLKNPGPEALTFMESFDQFSARHRMMGTTPYVLLLTSDLKKTFSGKNVKDIGSLKNAAANMNIDSASVRKALQDFSGEVGNKAMCSLKRLYSGRVKGNEDLNGLEDCTQGSDENRAILSAIQKNPGLFEEIVLTGKGLPPSLTLQNVDRIACGIQRQTESCEEMWKSWEPYTKTLKTGLGLAKYPLTIVAPYIAVPYFYADAAIELAGSVSELDKASIREDQILASVLKNEMDDEEFMVELGDRETKMTGAKINLLIAIAGAAGDIKEVGEILYIRILGSKANELTLLKLIDQGNEVAVKNYLKKNPKVKVQVSKKPITPTKKAKKNKKKS